MKNEVKVKGLLATKHANIEMSREVFIALEDGGFAWFHDNGNHMVTTYHHGRIEFDRENPFEAVDEMTQYHHDWPEYHYCNQEMIIDALSWLGYATGDVDLFEQIKDDHWQDMIMKWYNFYR